MKLPYQYRGVVLLALLTVVLPWGVWRFALRDTFGVWRDCRRLSARLEHLAPASIREPVSRPGGRELILSGGLLDTVRRTAAGTAVQIAAYEPLVSEQRDGIAVHTAQLILTGGYSALVRVIDQLERTLPQCRLRSLEWRATLDRRTRKTQLMLTLHIQQIAFKE